MSALALLNTVLGVLSKVFSWLESRGIFKQNEAVIALTIIRKVQEDIALAQKTENDLKDQYRRNPADVLRDDEFTRH